MSFLIKNFKAAARRPNLIPFSLEHPSWSAAGTFDSNFASGSNTPSVGSLSGTKDGANDTFTAPEAFDITALVLVLWNQLVLAPGAGITILSSTQIRIDGSVFPESGDNLEIAYVSQA